MMGFQAKLDAMAGEIAKKKGYKKKAQEPVEPIKVAPATPSPAPAPVQAPPAKKPERIVAPKPIEQPAPKPIETPKEEPAPKKRTRKSFDSDTEAFAAGHVPGDMVRIKGVGLVELE